jgi:hypothetical protein
MLDIIISLFITVHAIDFCKLCLIEHCQLIAIVDNILSWCVGNATHHDKILSTMAINCQCSIRHSLQKSIAWTVINNEIIISSIGIYVKTIVPTIHMVSTICEEMLHLLKKTFQTSLAFIVRYELRYNKR